MRDRVEGSSPRRLMLAMACSVISNAHMISRGAEPRPRLSCRGLWLVRATRFHGADAMDGFALRGEEFHRFVRIPGADYDYHADAAVENAQYFGVGDVALALEPLKQGRHSPGGAFDHHLDGRRQHATVKVVIERSSWRMPPLFQWLQREGDVADAEILRVFNCGIGMVVVVGARDADEAVKFLTAQGETVHRIGAVKARRTDEPQAAAV